MGASTIIWIIVAVIGVSAVIAFVMVRSGARRARAQREQATAVRAKAVALDRRLREDEAAEGYDQRRAGTA